MNGKEAEAVVLGCCQLFLLVPTNVQQLAMDQTDFRKLLQTPASSTSSSSSSAGRTFGASNKRKADNSR